MLYCDVCACVNVAVLVSVVSSYYSHVPYSGKFSPGKNFAKARSVVLRENFGRFIFAYTRMGEIKFQGIKC